LAELSPSLDTKELGDDLPNQSLSTEELTYRLLDTDNPHRELLAFHLVKFCKAIARHIIGYIAQL